MRRTIKNIVLALAGLAGLGAVLWFVGSAVLGVQLTIFRTGSMTPTMPTGAAALTVSIAPRDIRVGDVVTVQRAGAPLPVTHRVISVTGDPDDPDARTLVLKGDANDAPDAVPYEVTTARKVVAAAPGVGTAIEIARTPLFLGATTIGVAALVIWAFWPERPRAHRRGSRDQQPMSSAERAVEARP